MNIESLTGLSSGTVRSIVAMLIPGAIALGSWLYVLALQFPALAAWADRHDTIAALAVLALSLSAGQAVNITGSWWEKIANDNRLEKRELPTLSQDWTDYLTTRFEGNVIGLGYIAGLVTALKFELNTAIGLVWFWLGVLMLWALHGALDGCQVLVCSAITLPMSVTLLWCSFGTSRVLAETRSKLLRASGPSPDA